MRAFFTTPQRIIAYLVLNVRRVCTVQDTRCVQTFFGERALCLSCVSSAARLVLSAGKMHRIHLENVRVFKVSSAKDPEQFRRFEKVY
jgi:hypothetical protein